MRLFGKVLQTIRFTRRLSNSSKYRRYSSLVSLNLYNPRLSNFRLVRNVRYRPFVSKSGNSKTLDFAVAERNKVRPVLAAASSPFKNTDFISNILPVALLCSNVHHQKSIKIMLIPLNLSDADDEMARNTLATLSIIREHSRQIEAFTDNLMESSYPKEKVETVEMSEKGETPKLNEVTDAAEDLELHNNTEKKNESIDSIDKETQPKASYDATLDNVVAQVSANDPFDMITWNSTKRHLFASVPENLEEKLRKMAISSMQLAFEMDMTNIKDAIMMGMAKDKDFKFSKPVQAEPPRSLKNPTLTLTTHLEVDPSEEVDTVPLNFNALIQGTIEIDPSRISAAELGDMEIPEYNDRVTSIAANICSTALQKGFPTDIGRMSYSTASKASGSGGADGGKPRSTNVVCVRQGDKGCVSPGNLENAKFVPKGASSAGVMTSASGGCIPDLTAQRAKFSAASAADKTPRNPHVVCVREGDKGCVSPGNADNPMFVAIGAKESLQAIKTINEAGGTEKQHRSTATISLLTSSSIIGDYSARGLMSCKAYARALVEAAKRRNSMPAGGASSAKPPPPRKLVSVKMSNCNPATEDCVAPPPELLAKAMEMSSCEPQSSAAVIEAAKKPCGTPQKKDPCGKPGKECPPPDKKKPKCPKKDPCQDPCEEEDPCKKKKPKSQNKDPCDGFDPCDKDTCKKKEKKAPCKQAIEMVAKDDKKGKDNCNPPEKKEHASSKCNTEDPCKAFAAARKAKGNTFGAPKKEENKCVPPKKDKSDEKKSDIQDQCAPKKTVSASKCGDEKKADSKPKKSASESKCGGDKKADSQPIKSASASDCAQKKSETKPRCKKKSDSKADAKSKCAPNKSDDEKKAHSKSECAPQKSDSKSDSKSQCPPKKSASSSSCAEKKSDPKKSESKCGAKNAETKPNCQAKKSDSKSDSKSKCGPKDSDTKSDSKSECAPKKSASANCGKKDDSKKASADDKKKSATKCPNSASGPEPSTKPNCSKGGKDGGKDRGKCKFSTLALFSVNSSLHTGTVSISALKRKFSTLQKTATRSFSGRKKDNQKCGAPKIPKNRKDIKYVKKDCFKEKDEEECNDTKKKEKDACGGGKDKKKGDKENKKFSTNHNRIYPSTMTLPQRGANSTKSNKNHFEQLRFLNTSAVNVRSFQTEEEKDCTIIENKNKRSNSLGATKPSAAKPITNEAIKISEPCIIEKVQESIPTFSDYDVLIRTEAVALSGSDIHYYETGGKVCPGMTIGHDAAGVVEQVGSCVTGLKVGDRIAIESGLSCGICDFCKRGAYNICSHLIYNGFLTKYQVHPADLCHKIPTDVTLEEGALAQTLALGCQACFKAYITPTANVLLIGSCPTAVAASLCARAIGAKNVCIVCSMRDTLQSIHQEFQFPFVHYEPGMQYDHILEGVFASLNDWPDVVINCAISETTMNIGVMALKPCGVCVLAECESECACFNAMDVLMKNIKLVPSFRSINMFPTALKLMQSGQAPVGQLIAKTFRWNQIEMAFRSALHESNVGNRKVIVKCAEEDYSKEDTKT